MTTPKTKIVDELLTRRVDKILPSKKGLEKLINKKKIKLYNGIDPTGTRLHLGHLIGLKKLMEFAEAGHEVIVLFGTGTVLMGDPSERDTGRKLITEKEIEKNIKNWKKQVEPIVDFSKVKIKYNSDWLTKLTLKEIIKIASNISAVQLFKRDMFQRRIKKGDTVWFHETMYPLFQGYDSVVLDVDLELGGSDQEFNMLIGRELMKKMKGKEKYVITWPMILGTDGKQMSKTSGNCVWMDDNPSDMFGKLMSIPDSQIIAYMELVSDIPLDRVDEVNELLKTGKLNPIDAKKELALDIVKTFHGEISSLKAKENFEDTFQKQLPKFKKVVKYKSTLLELVTTQVKSKSDAKRLISQGAVDVDGKSVNNPLKKLKGGEEVKIGKKLFIKVKKK